MTSLTSKSKDALLKALMRELDTRDKRYMFLRIRFKELVSIINLDGSPINVSYEIYEEFEKQSMLGSLISCLNTDFDLDLYLEVKVND